MYAIRNRRQHNIYHYIENRKKINYNTSLIKPTNNFYQLSERLFASTRDNAAAFPNSYTTTISRNPHTNACLYTHLPSVAHSHHDTMGQSYTPTHFSTRSCLTP